MKILHIITGLSDGGAEAVLYRLCTLDKNNRHRVVSLMNAGKYGPLLRQAGIAVDLLNMPRSRVTAKGLFRLWRILRHDRPDVIQTWMYHADLLGGVLARIAGIKQVFWGIRHSNIELSNNKYSTVFIARLCALLSHIIPLRIVCCSHQAAQVHQKLGYDSKKITIIQNGYNPAQFFPNPTANLQIRNDFGIPTDALLIGMVARFDKQKDHATLIAALGIIKKRGYDFLCILAGSGLVRENIELTSLLRTHEVETHVLLVGPRSDIPNLMNAFDLHVLSSLGEAFPNVLAEAMACGTPCVTTDVGDAALIVGKTGWVAPTSDPVSLADSIILAVSSWQDKDSWREKQQACRTHIVANFNIDHMLQSYSKIWRETQ